MNHVNHVKPVKHASEMGTGSRRHTTRLQDLAIEEQRAWRLDTIALHLARGRAAIDVALGEILLRLGEDDRLDELGASCKKDYANEQLGLPARTFFALEELALGLRSRPILKQAVLAGEVSTVKARIAFKADADADEAAVTVAAMEMTVEQLKSFVNFEDEDLPPYRVLRWSMTPEQQDKLDAAVSLAKELEGYDAPEWKLQSRIASDYLKHDGAEGEATVEEVKEGKARKKKGKDPVDEMTEKGDSACQALEAHFEACELINGDPVTNNPLGLDGAAKRLVARRYFFSEPLGRALTIISAEDLWRPLGYRSFGEYCLERLGISESTARERIRLERRMRLLPALRKALKTGVLTYTKAVQVGRRATPGTVDELIREAASTTFQQTKAAADKEESQRDRERGERKLRGPQQTVELVGRAIDLARRKFAEAGEQVDDGEAWKRVSEWFFRRYEKQIRKCDWRRKWEREVFLRYGGLCAVPGCTRAAVHLHHIIFQEDGGPDVPWNTVALCHCHHQRCAHKGTLILWGRSGEHLTWVFKARDEESGYLIPISEWETWGYSDVRRRGYRGRRGVGA